MAIQKELQDRLIGDYNCKKPEKLIGANPHKHKTASLKKSQYVFESEKIEDTLPSPRESVARSG